MQNKTIKQLADELHVSKTAIRKYMTEDFRAKHIEIDRDKVITISPDGCKLIAEIIENNRKPIVETPENAVSADVLNIPREVWEAIHDQLESQKKQIEDYSERLKETTAALKEAQETAGRAQALHAGTLQRQLQEPEEPKGTGQEKKKKGLFDWFKKNKEVE